MNVVVLVGRLTRDPDIRYTNEAEPRCIARFTLAVDRGYKKDGQQAADFIGCTVFGKAAEVVEQYVRKGTKICLEGRIQTGSYTDRDGKKIYTTDVIANHWEFAESRKAQEAAESEPKKATQAATKDPETDENGFMNIPDAIDEELPFN